MGLDVELIRVEQLGTSPRRRRDTQVSVVPDMGDRFADMLARVQYRGKTPMLDRVYPYGLVELAPAEMTQFLSELGEVESSTEGPAEQEILTAVRRLAETCRGDRDLRLRVIGD